MKNNILPAALAENTTISYLSKVSQRSQFIYCAIVLIIILCIALLPFITVDVSVQGNGIIRPVTEKTDIKTLVPGTIDSITVREGETVYEGQPLVLLQSNIIESKWQLNRLQLWQKQQEVRDLSILSKLINGHYKPDSILLSGTYKKQFSEFEARLEDIGVSDKKIRRDLAIKQKLYNDSKIISLQELEDKRYELNKNTAAFNATFKQQVMNWQNELSGRKMECQQLIAEGEQLQQQKIYNTIKAPVKGTIQQINGRYKGVYIQAGEAIGVISPDSTLIGECYITPADIGLLKKDMKVQMQVDAFNYNSWGSVTGAITEIGNDFIAVDNRPVYIVRCRLANDTLMLKNGYKASLKKGMTFHSRFIVTRRTLWQLLYDKADNWLNPAVK